MIKLKEIKPVFTNILVTSRKYEKDVKEHGVTTITAGTLMEYQQVIATGDSVRRVSEGDIIKINPRRYAVRKHDENSVRNELNLNPITGFNFPTVEVNDDTFLLLDEADIEYIVKDYVEVEDDVPSTLIVPEKPKIIV